MAWPDLDRIVCYSHGRLDHEHGHMSDALFQLSKPDRFDETIRLLLVHGVDAQVGLRGWAERIAEGVLLFTQDEKSYLANECLAADARPHYEGWIRKVEAGECPFCANEHPITKEPQPLLTDDEHTELRAAVRVRELNRTWCAHCKQHHTPGGDVPVGVSNGIRIAACPGGLYHPLGHEDMADDDVLYGALVDERGYYMNCPTEMGKRHHATVRGNWRHSDSI